MLTTVILYVALCTSRDKCDAYEPSTWTASSEKGGFFKVQVIDNSTNQILIEWKA